MSLKEINSPYKLIYWSYRNLVSSALGIPVDFIPKSSYTPEQLGVFKWNTIESAVSRGVVELEGLSSDSARFSINFPLTSTAEVAFSEKERFRISSNKFVIDYSALESIFKDSNSTMLVDVIELLFVLLFTIEATETEPYEVQIINGGSRLSSEKNLYYFMLFEYLPIQYSLEPIDVEVLNSLLYVDTCKFKGYFKDELIERSAKREHVSELGIKKGSIVFLYKRNYFTNGTARAETRDKNPLVESVQLARVKNITDSGMTFETYALKETLEQNYWDFSQLSEEVQDLYVGFTDYVRNSFRTGSESIMWDSLGVQYVMNNDSIYSEHYFITRLESIHPVEVMTLDSNFNFESLSLSVQDAVFYLLLEYGVKFNETLFIEMYNLKNAEVIRQAVQDSISRLENVMGYSVLEDL